jgi:hypothetical protein
MAAKKKLVKKTIKKKLIEELEALVPSLRKKKKPGKSKPTPTHGTTRPPRKAAKKAFKR